MRAVIQRVENASVSVDGELISSIGEGIMVLLGINSHDCEKDAEYISQKLINLRIFNDENGVMNRSLKDIGGEMLLISQFTLYGDARNGRRPSYIEAARPEIAQPMYESIIESIKKDGINVKGGVFGAHMKVSLINDGPVTILLDSTKAF